MITLCKFVYTTRGNHPIDGSTQTEEEEEQFEGALHKQKKFIAFESCHFKLLEQCYSCGQEVWLNTFVRGTYIASGT